MTIEHAALLVRDPIAMAAWYVAHLGMRVTKEGPPPANARFLADGNGMLLEAYAHPTLPVPDYAGMDPLVLHVAFRAEDVAAERARLIAAGAAPVGDVVTAPNGDVLGMVRDPWGLAVQIVRRG